MLQSLQVQDAFGMSTEWVGLENFRNLLDDPTYLNSFQRTAFFSVLVAAVGIVVSLVLAIFADRIVRGQPEANKAMTNTVQMLAEVVESFERVNIAALDVGQAEKWSCSLTESAKQIQALRKRINQLQKEQDQ